MRGERWLFAPGSARRLAALRIGLSTVLAVRLARSVFVGLAGQPRALFRPISFVHLLSSMPPLPVIAVLQGVGLASAVLAAAGLRPRVTLPTAWGCAVVLNGLVTSVGMVVHNDVMPLLALVPLLPAATGGAWSLDLALARRRGVTHERTRGGEVWSVRYGWPVRASMVVVAGGYFFSGLAKLMFSGPAWVLGDNLRWILYTSSDAQGRPNALALFVADRSLLAHLLAGATLCIELGFPLVLWRPRAAWFFLPGAVALHTGIWATMHLDYFPWAATAFVVFVDWPPVIDWLGARAAARWAARPEPP